MVSLVAVVSPDGHVPVARSCSVSAFTTALPWNRLDSESDSSIIAELPSLNAIVPTGNAEGSSSQGLLALASAVLPAHL